LSRLADHRQEGPALPWPDVGSFDVTAISFDDLINLERAAVEANDAVKGLPYTAEAWKPWFDASAEFQTAVTAYANAEGKDRVVVEMDVKKAVRHPVPTEDAA
jgi:hypothetical protein